jgi:hypothetical protein
MAASEGHGEAGGVDDVSIVGRGPGADEVVPVRVGEEAVAPATGGGAPRVHGEGEPPRHLYRHLPSRNFIKKIATWPPSASSGARALLELVALVYMPRESGAFRRKEEFSGLPGSWMVDGGWWMVDGGCWLDSDFRTR